MWLVIGGKQECIYNGEHSWLNCNVSLLEYFSVLVLPASKESNDFTHKILYVRFYGMLSFLVKIFCNYNI